MFSVIGNQLLTKIPDLFDNLPLESSVLRIVNNLPSAKTISNIQEKENIKSKHITELRIQKEKMQGNEVEYTKLKQQELQYRSKIIASMIKSQIQIAPEEMESPQLRNKIINQMVKIHYQKNLKTQILHQATIILDRYLSLCSIQQNSYLKMSITSLFIANKLLSKKAKKIQRWLKHIPETSKEQILSTESSILQTLNYQIVFPFALNFFHILSTYFQMTKIKYRFCIYMLELALIDCQFKKFPEIVIALSSIYVSFSISQNSDFQQQKKSFQKLLQILAVTIDQISQCSRCLREAKKKDNKKQQSNVFKKFCLNENHCVAKLTLK